jgi:hypothetical protein
MGAPFLISEEDQNLTRQKESPGPSEEQLQLANSCVFRVTTIRSAENEKRMLEF